MRLGNVLEKANTPGAVLLALVLLSAVLGFLYFFRVSPASETPATAPTTHSESRSTAGSTSLSGEETTNGSPVTTNSVRAMSGTNGGDNRDGRALTSKTSGTDSEEKNDNRDPRDERAESLAGSIGLPEKVGGCPENGEEGEGCVRAAVKRSTSDSTYIGGGTDLAPDKPVSGNTMMYFETPALKPCEYARRSYSVKEGRYTVIVLGEGSFAEESEEECVPQ